MSSIVDIAVMERRRRENADLIRRMKEGESLALVAPQATWWPPREIILKDLADIDRVLGVNNEDSP